MIRTVVALALLSRASAAPRTSLTDFPCPRACTVAGLFHTAADCTAAGGTSTTGSCTYPEDDGSNSGASSDKACGASTVNGVETFHAMIDPYSSETGHYVFAECVDADNTYTAHPTLKMKRDVNYVFDQSHLSNWMHPLGFAYYTDGAHVEVDELELGITKYGTTCADGTDPTCQAPYYYKQSAETPSIFQGKGNDASAPEEGDFGLDAIEPLFYNARANWAEDKYAVHVKLADQTTYDEDIYYFCHIHAGMTGRIKVVDSAGALVQATDSTGGDHTPDDYYTEPSAFDKACGTHGLGDYEDACPNDRFVCEGNANSAMLAFGECLHAMDCHMQELMRATLHKDDPMVTFMHQMIPHHQNAVNMAKAVLKEGPASLADEGVEDMVWGIINSQNHQIQLMQGWLEGAGYDPEADKCEDKSSARGRRNLLFYM